MSHPSDTADSDHDRIYNCSLPVQRILMRRHGTTAETAADCVSQARLQIFHALRNGSAVESPFTLLLISAERVLLQHLSRERKFPQATSGPGSPDASTPLDRVADVRANPLEALLASEKHEAVRKALATLPREQLALMKLRYFKNLTFEEIADVLGITREAARVRHFRILQTLRHELKKY